MAGLAASFLIFADLADSALAQTSSPRAIFPPTPLLISAGVAIGIMVLLWWMRERRIQAQHDSLGIFHGLSEDIIAAPTPSAIAEKLATVLPSVTQATMANLYIFQKRTKSLERVPTS